MQNPILRLPATAFNLGVSRSTLYAHIADRLCVPPIKLGARAVGWPQNEIEAVKAARIAGKTDEEIRQLVATLVAARKDAAK